MFDLYEGDVLHKEQLFIVKNTTGLAPIADDQPEQSQSASNISTDSMSKRKEEGISRTTPIPTKDHLESYEALQDQSPNLHTDIMTKNWM